MIRVIVVDDHPMMREGITKSITVSDKISVIAQASDGEEALTLVAKWQPDLVLLDIQMPKMDGISCAKELLRLHKDVKIIMLSMFQEKVMYDKLQEMGVHGYLLKTSEASQIIEAIEYVQKGKTHFKLGIDTFENKIEIPIKNKQDNEELLNSLSKREKQILTYLSKGLTSNEISKELFISPRTVDTHKTNLMKKLDIHKTTGLVRFAFKVGLT